MGIKNFIAMLLGSILFLAIGFLTGYYVNVIQRDNKENAQSYTSEFEEDVLSFDGDSKIGQDEYLGENLFGLDDNEQHKEIVFIEGAKLIFKTIYSDCEHEKAEETLVPKELYSTNESEIKEKYAEWDIERISDEGLTLYTIVYGKCEKHYIIREHESKIGVFYEDPAWGNQPKQVIDIDIRYFREEDRMKLKNGIKANSEEELAQIIEDFTS